MANAGVDFAVDDLIEMLLGQGEDPGLARDVAQQDQFKMEKAREPFDKERVHQDVSTRNARAADALDSSKRA